MTASRWLASLVRRLRGEGLAIPPSRLLDAARALEVSGDLVLDRDMLGTVLRLVLAQRRADRPRFDRAFLAFMRAHGPPRPGRRPKLPHPGGGDVAGGSGRAPSPGTLAGPPSGTPQPGPSRTPPVPSRGAPRREDRSLSRPVSEEPRSQAQGAGQGDDEPVPLETSPANRWQAWAEAAFEAGELAPSEKPSRVPGEADASRPASGERHVSRGPTSGGRTSATGDRATARTGEWILAEGAALDVHEAARRMASALYLRRSRRSRRFKRGRLDLKATLARSFRTGGVPFRLLRRRRRLKRARLVLLADVSGSMRQAADLVLAMLGGLHEAFTTLAVIAFVDHPVDVTAAVRCGRRLSDLDGINWMSQSDYGNTFFKLITEHDRILRRDALVVIVGDARNNGIDPMAWALAELRSRVGACVWLNAEPRRRWNTGDSVMAAYAPWCDRIFRCTSMADLRDAAEALAHRAARWV